MLRCLIIGFVIWLVASVALRFGGQYLLHPESLIAIAALLLVSFPAMAVVARRICADAALPWPAAGVFLVMPSLVLDTFSSAFFPVVYPNIPQQAAGLFGGWIRFCCAGALFGVSFMRR
jgi:hypothetical protein